MASLRDQASAFFLSRPSNPSSNVVSDAELAQLFELAKSWQVPLVVDCAYGDPFPGLCYVDAQVAWQPGMVLVLSLSKLGLPGARTGIVVGDADLIDKVVSANTILSLANGNLGPSVMTSILNQGRLSDITDGMQMSHVRDQTKTRLMTSIRRACVPTKRTFKLPEMATGSL